jgi:hypothetical protein
MRTMKAMRHRPRMRSTRNALKQLTGRPERSLYLAVIAVLLLCLLAVMGVHRVRSRAWEAEAIWRDAVDGERDRALTRLRVQLHVVRHKNLILLANDRPYFRSVRPYVEICRENDLWESVVAHYEELHPDLKVGDMAWSYAPPGDPRLRAERDRDRRYIGALEARLAAYERRRPDLKRLEIP